MKKGFTIVELLVVIAILTILLLIAVPSYIGISISVNKKMYETKKGEVIAKAEIFAEENGKSVFDIKELIESGLLEPDNELGEFKDPQDDRDMSCDIINVIYSGSSYDISITENNECLSREELENLHGIVNLKLENTSGGNVTKLSDTDWLPLNGVNVVYELKEEYKAYEPYIESILWYGEREQSCDKEHLNDCKKYFVENNVGIKNTSAYLQMRINVNGIVIQTENSVQVSLDKEEPIARNITEDNEYNTNSERKVSFELTDGSGSGIKEYGITSTKSCGGVSFKRASDGLQNVYLGKGTYYICVKDKVGNVTSDSNLDKYKFEVTNIENRNPSLSISVKTTADGYNNLSPNVTINAKDANNSTEGLKMCVSITNFRLDCSWEDYKTTKKVVLDTHEVKNYDGIPRTIYVTIQDKYGNITEKSISYNVYKSCTSKTGWKEVSNDSATVCPKCGDVKYTSKQERYDIYLNDSSGNPHVCEHQEVPTQCNIPRDCCERAKLTGDWHATTACTKKCDAGTQIEEREVFSGYDSTINCTSKVEEQYRKRIVNCNTQSCCERTSSNDTLSFTNWTNSGSCSKKCDTGTQKQVRSAYSKYDSNVDCSHLASQSELERQVPCNTQDCCSSVSFNLQWSEVPWGSCSKTCGGGTQWRSRIATSSYDSSVDCSNRIDRSQVYQEQSWRLQPCDTTPPSVTITPENRNNWVQSREITATITDSSGVAGYVFSSSTSSPVSWNSASGNTVTANYTFTSNKTIYLWVKDTVGNKTYVAITENYIDKTRPTFSDVSGNPDSWTTQDVTLTVNLARDTGGSGLHSTAAYSFDGGATWQKDNTKVYSSNTSNINVKVRDNAGNVSTSQTVNITKIDKNAPTISSVTGNPSDWTNQDVYLTIHGASDGTNESGLASEPYSFNGGSTWQSDNTKGYAGNTENIRIRVRDVAGNIYSYETINITKVDKSAPVISSFTAERDGSNVKVEVSATDQGSGIRTYHYSKDGGATWYTSSEGIYNFTSDSSLDIRVYVSDAVGNNSDTQSKTVEAKQFIVLKDGNPMNLTPFSWETSGKCNNTINFHPSFYINVEGCGDTGSNGLALTVETIDITNFSKAVLKQSGDSSKFKLSFCASNKCNEIEATSCGPIQDITTKPYKVCEYDISGLTGEHQIQLFYYISSKSSSSTLHVYEFVLE